MKTILVKILTRAATLNPQDSAVLNALHLLGYTNISGVQVGRLIVLEVSDTEDIDGLKARLETDLKKPQMAGHFNPITDTYTIEEVVDTKSGA